MSQRKRRLKNLSRTTRKVKVKKDVHFVGQKGFQFLSFSLSLFQTCFMLLYPTLCCFMVVNLLSASKITSKTHLASQHESLQLCSSHWISFRIIGMKTWIAGRKRWSVLSVLLRKTCTFCSTCCPGVRRPHELIRLTQRETFTFLVSTSCFEAGILDSKFSVVFSPKTFVSLNTEGVCFVLLLSPSLVLFICVCVCQSHPQLILCHSRSFFSGATVVLKTNSFLFLSRFARRTTAGSGQKVDNTIDSGRENDDGQDRVDKQRRRHSYLRQNTWKGRCQMKRQKGRIMRGSRLKRKRKTRWTTR